MRELMNKMLINQLKRNLTICFIISHTSHFYFNDRRSILTWRIPVEIRLNKKLSILRGYCTSYRKISMFCVLSQNHQHLFEK